MKKQTLWVMVRERPLRTNPDWKTCHTYVKEYLANDGQWYVATNSAKRFTREEAKRTHVNHGTYFEREDACRKKASNY